MTIVWLMSIVFVSVCISAAIVIFTFVVRRQRQRERERSAADMRSCHHAVGPIHDTQSRSPFVPQLGIAVPMGVHHDDPIGEEDKESISLSHGQVNLSAIHFSSGSINRVIAAQPMESHITIVDMQRDDQAGATVEMNEEAPEEPEDSAHPCIPSPGELDLADLPAQYLFTNRTPQPDVDLPEPPKPKSNAAPPRVFGFPLLASEFDARRAAPVDPLFPVPATGLTTVLALHNGCVIDAPAAPLRVTFAD